MRHEASTACRERRRYPRYALNAPLIAVNSHGIESYRSRDISAGGAFLRARRAPPLGSRMRLEFDIGRDRHFAVWGTVVREERTFPPSMAVGGFAVAFELSEDQRGELARALEHEVA